jgi:MFS family permease
LNGFSRNSAKPARRKRSSNLSAPIAKSSRSGEAGEIAAASAPENDRLDTSVWKISTVALFGALLAQLDATIVNVSLSNLAADLNSRLSTIQWVTSGYLLALTLVLPLNGWLVDRIGAKALHLWCFSAFTLSSALCGLAWSANSLIAFCVLEGISGGLLAPMTQMMIARATGKHMARVAGYMLLPVLLAPVLGPIIAGAILQYASWRLLFLVNLPVSDCPPAGGLVPTQRPARDDAADNGLAWSRVALSWTGDFSVWIGADRPSGGPCPPFCGHCDDRRFPLDGPAKTR